MVTYPYERMIFEQNIINQVKRKDIWYDRRFAARGFFGGERNWLLEILQVLCLKALQLNKRVAVSFHYLNKHYVSVWVYCKKYLSPNAN
jgi:hypothetical protein